MPSALPACDLSVVVPLYNEEENVGHLVEEICQALSGRNFELVLVDDGSEDRTVVKIPRRPEIRVLEFSRNTGQSAAMFAGIHAATGGIVVTMDGDLQNDPADIPRLLEELEKGFDLICGYRAKRKDTFFRRLQSRIANFIRSRFTGDGVRDTGCSLKAMRLACREALIPFKGMHRFMPALIKGMGYRVGEIPVNHRPRIAGKSKYGFGNRAFRATRDMFGVKWLLSRQFQIRLKKQGD